MYEKQLVLASSHIRRAAEQPVLETLKTLVHEVNTSYIPVGDRRDPRVQPLGRLISARLVQRPGDEYVVQGTAQYFEPGDRVEPADQERLMPLRIVRPGRLHVSFDQSHKKPEPTRIITLIGELIGSAPREESVSGEQHSGVLAFSGTFESDSIREGLARLLRRETLAELRQRIKSLFDALNGSERERLLVFHFALVRSGTALSTQTVLTNPAGAEIDAFFDRGLQQLDSRIDNELGPDSNVRTAVFEYTNEDLRLLYRIRLDGVPMAQGEAE